MNASKTTMNLIEGLMEEDDQEKVKTVNKSKKKIRKMDKRKPCIKSK